MSENSNSDKFNESEKRRQKHAAETKLELAMRCFNNNDQRCIDLLKEAIKLSEESGNISKKLIAAKCDLNLSKMKFQQECNFQQIERNLQSLLNELTSDDIMLKVRIFCNLGFLNLKRYEQDRKRGIYSDDFLHVARKHYNEAIQQENKMGPVYLAETCNQLGTVYGYLGNMKQSTMYYKKSIEQYKKNGDNKRAAESCFNLACDLMVANEIKAADEFANLAMKEFIKPGIGSQYDINNCQNLKMQIDKKKRFL